MNHNRMSLGMAFLTVVALGARVADAAVSLNSASGPTATYGQTFDLTALGTYDWVYYAGAPRSANPYAGNERAGFDLFSDISKVGPTSSTVLSSGGYSADQGATIVYSNGANPTNNGAGSAGNTYIRGGAVGDGLTFTYKLAANATQIINVYVENYNALGIMNVSSSASGALYADSGSVGLPSSDGINGAGSGHGAGVYSFVVTNDASVTDTLTFTYTIGALNGTSSSAGIQAITVSPIPEPASIGVLGAALAGLLHWKRRNH